MRIIEPRRPYTLYPKPPHRHWRLAIMCLGIFGLIGAYIAYALLRPLPAIYPALVDMPQAETSSVRIEWPSKGQAAVAASGYGMLAKTPKAKAVPTASTAKIMTALAILKKRPLSVGKQGPLIPITKKDEAIYNDYFLRDGSLAKVKAGEKITQYQTLQAILLPSANNVADTMAIWAFGSLKAYHRYANDFAESIGLRDTRFAVDASGLSPKTVSTPEDLVTLSMVAMQNPVFAEIVGQKTATIPVAGKIYNVNRLLGIDGIFGIKTGNSDEAKGCFVVAAKQQVAPGQSVTIYAAIMGEETIQDAFEATLPLLKSVKQGFGSQVLAKKQMPVAQYNVPWASSIVAQTQKEVKAVGWRAVAQSPKIELEPISAQASNGQIVGTISSPRDKKASSPIVLTRSVPKPSTIWLLTHPL